MNDDHRPDRWLWRVGLIIAFVALMSVVLARPRVSAGPLAVATVQPSIVRISVGPGGAESDGKSALPSISADGRYVAFNSKADNLLPGDTNRKTDVFVYDAQAGTVARASVTHNGGQTNGDSYEPSISGDGRFVAFTSKASNMLPTQTRGSGNTYRGGGINVYLWDRETGATTIVSRMANGKPADGHTFGADIALDGSHVGFTSHSKGIMPFDANGIKRDAFIYGRLTGVTRYVDVLPSGVNPWEGGAGTSLSADGSTVAFQSKSALMSPGWTDLNKGFDVYAFSSIDQRVSPVVITEAGRNADKPSKFADISADGRYVAFSIDAALVAADSNATTDIYVRDLVAGTTTLVSLTADGRPGNGPSTQPTISADGRYVSFISSATNLPGGAVAANNIYVHDRHTGQTRRVIYSLTNGEPNGKITYQVMSADGRFVAFSSGASNLTPSDTNRVDDIFLVRLGPDGYRIGGVITDDASGEPVSGAVVRALLGDAPAGVGVSMSDGRFSVDGLAPGSYTLLPDKRGYTFAPSEPIEVSGEGSIDVALTGAAAPLYDISGRVLDGADRPVSGVMLTTDTGRSTITDADGRYRLGALPAGDHRLTPAGSGLAFAPTSILVALPGPDGDVDGQDFTAVTSHTISGKVVTRSGAAVAGVRISIDGETVFAVTTQRGQFTLTGLAPGTYTLRPVSQTHRFMPESLSLTVPPNQSKITFVANTSR